MSKANIISGPNQTWEIGRFSMKTRRYLGKTLMNSQKLNGESNRNIIMNETVIMCNSNRAFLPVNDYSEFIAL